MKKAIWILMSLVVQLASAAEEIDIEYLMKSSEFDTIEHKVAKDQYIIQVTKLLKKLRIQQGDYKSDRDDDPERLQVLIRDRERWAAIRDTVEKICDENDLHLKTCDALAAARLNIADFIKKYPEGSKELERFKQKSARVYR